jgi:hypothetical protein
MPVYIDKTIKYHEKSVRHRYGLGLHFFKYPNQLSESDSSDNCEGTNT